MFESMLMGWLFIILNELEEIKNPGKLRFWWWSTLALAFTHFILGIFKGLSNA